jgi:hypothetical protein
MTSRTHGGGVMGLRSYSARVRSESRNTWFGANRDEPCLQIRTCALAEAAGQHRDSICGRWLRQPWTLVSRPLARLGHRSPKLGMIRRPLSSVSDPAGDELGDAGAGFAADEHCDAGADGSAGAVDQGAAVAVSAVEERLSRDAGAEHGAVGGE